MRAAAACAEGQLSHGGFCYDKLESSVKDHLTTCYPDPTTAGGRNGMPAVPTAELLALLAAEPDPPAEPVAVGVYR